MQTSMLQAYMTPAILTGVAITGMNIANIRRSPEYRENMNLSDYTRFAVHIAAKGSLFGIFYPVTWASLIFATNSSSRFEAHLVPYSVWRAS